MKKTFMGIRLRRFREERGLTQVALARALELSPSYLNQLEQNQRPLSVPVLLICAVQYFTAGPPIPEDVSIVGGVDMATDIYVMGRFPSHLFLAALSLFVVGLGVLIGLKIKRWKGKTHDR